MQGRRGASSRQSRNQLPVIAPRDDQPAPVLPSSSATNTRAPPSELSRNRLPPRSRTGCWTCRNRKVKCDEGTPKCKQCLRLGHECDYRPRLAFKDETKKYIVKYEGAAEENSEAWDPSSALQAVRRPQASRLEPTEDHLPPFSLLQNDEEWENKAEHHRPGSFYVVLNAASFTPDRDGRSVSREPDVGLDHMGTRRRGSLRIQIPGELSTDGVFHDPNVVILNRFEEMSRPPTSSTLRSVSTISPSPSSSVITCTEGIGSLTVAPSPVHIQQPPGFDPLSPSDTALMIHYRQAVRNLLVLPLASTDDDPSSNISMDTPDIFEREARLYEPLHHALLALSALSLAHRQNRPAAEGMEHYQQAVRRPSERYLQTDEDLASNGPFLMHYILLIYDIAVGEPLDFWARHMAYILQVTPIRQAQFEFEAFPFVLWRVAMIDTNALLSGIGNGNFARTILTTDVFPSTQQHRFATRLGGASPGHPADASILKTVTDLSRNTMLLAAEFALLARDMRIKAMRLRQANDRATAAGLQRDHAQGLAKTNHIRERFKLLWSGQAVARVTRDATRQAMASGVRAFLERAYSTYHMCMIYSYTSMYATQLAESQGTPPTVGQSVTLILRLATEIVRNRGQLDNRFLVFPAFIAGFAATSAADKTQARRIIGAMEQESIGNNTRATRKLLEAVYEAQEASFERVGHARGVDWIQVMESRGLHVVSFGL